MAKQFVFEQVLNIVTPPGAAGLRFDTKEEGTNAVLGDATVSIQTEGGPVLTLVGNAEGKNFFESLDAGVYRVTVTLTGYDTLIVEKEISTGVTSFSHFKLVKTV